MTTLSKAIVGGHITLVAATLLAIAPLGQMSAQAADSSSTNKPKPQHTNTAKTSAVGVPVFELTPNSERISDRLKLEADSAAAHGQVALVDIGATWCAPCKAFQSTLNDPAMVASLKGARLIHLDFDVWYHDLVNAGYIAAYDLPVLFVVKPDGGEGDTFNNGLWQDEIDKNKGKNVTMAQVMGPPLKAFLATAHQSETKLSSQ